MRIIRLLLLTLLILAMPCVSFAQFSVSVTLAPPALPLYVQPEAPGDGYIWTPGYWAYGNEGYFWVPGTWVMAPEVGYLWTPGYWGWGDNAYAWHAGYWGEHVGFYGGVDYGYGYGGSGYQGGYWNHGSFQYNRAVNNIRGTNIHNAYDKRVTSNRSAGHVSYNGGRGGISSRPTQAEEGVAHEQHAQPTALQNQHVQAAGGNHALLASVNHGRPAVAATAKPGEFNGHGVVAAKQAGAPYKAAATRGAAQPAANRNAEKPGNTAARTEAAHTAPAARNNAAPSRESNAHTQSPAREQPAARAQPTARPQSPAREQPAARAQPASHAQPAARPQAAPRAETHAQPAARQQPAAQHAQPAARQQPAARPEPAARPQPVAHAQPAARPQAAPSAARPAEKEEKR
jgi:hypothetical protein